MEVAIEPSRELSRLAIRIEKGIGIYARARDGALALNTKWEAPRHAWTLTNLAIRHAEATALMARTDAALMPSAFVTARAAVETAARCIWLLQPDDVWEREARWLALLHEGGRLGTRSQLAGDLTRRTQSESIRDFASAVEARLPPGTRIPGTPSADKLLREFGTDLDHFYVIASQYSHGAELATRAYRANLGTDAEYGEVANLADWLYPLSHAWQAATAGVIRLMQVTQVPFTPVLRRVENQVEEAITALQRSLVKGTDAMPDS